jgi:hypothetical protein
VKFFDEESGATLEMDRYYGFSDSGGIAGSHEGYPTAGHAIAAIGEEYGAPVDISCSPEDLGSFQIAVITGQQYVDRIQAVDVLSTYGHFVEETSHGT